MGQDLRKLFKDERETKKFRLKKGHESRFLDQLEKEMPKQKKSSFYVLKMAALIVILISIGSYTYDRYAQEDPIKTTIVDKDNEINETDNLKKSPVLVSLGDLSPDLRKVENYYVAHINLELSKLEISKENKALVNDFMERLSELNKEYQRLNIELNQIGPNDQTINALIKNLQLRLQLLHKLKEKLNELKSSKNEQVAKSVV